MKQSIIALSFAVLSSLAPLTNVYAQSPIAPAQLTIVVQSTDNTYVPTTLIDADKAVELHTDSYTSIDLTMGVYEFVVSSDIVGYDNTSTTCNDIEPDEQQDADTDKNTFQVFLYAGRDVTCIVTMAPTPHSYVTYLPFVSNQ